MKPQSRIPVIVGVTSAGACVLTFRFDDGQRGQVDIASMIAFDGVFAPLKDPAYFAQVRVDDEAGTIVWPNGADLDPLVLHSAITGKPLKF